MIFSPMCAQELYLQSHLFQTLDSEDLTFGRQDRIDTSKNAWRECRLVKVRMVVQGIVQLSGSGKEDPLRQEREMTVREREELLIRAWQLET